MGRNLLILLFSVLLCAPAAAEEPLELGLYAPRLVFKSAVAQKTYARQIAAAISKASGLPMEGRAFTRASDLESFVSAGRLDLVLVDSTVLVDTTELVHNDGFDVVGIGSGPEGRRPKMAVLSKTPGRGINAFEGQKLALLAGTLERHLASNLLLEGEVDVGRFFQKARVAPDMSEIVRWLDTGRADVTIGYASVGKAHGLHVVSKLVGFSLPVLAIPAGKLSEAQRGRLHAALARRIVVPAHGPMTRLVAESSGDPAAALRRAASLKPGQRAVRRAVWAPLRVERLGDDAVVVKPSGRYPLPVPTGRWRVPDYPDL